jgi:hypothetical protein
MLLRKIFWLNLKVWNELWILERTRELTAFISQSRAVAENIFLVLNVLLMYFRLYNRVAKHMNFVAARKCGRKCKICNDQ